MCQPQTKVVIRGRFDDTPIPNLLSNSSDGVMLGGGGGVGNGGLRTNISTKEDG